MGEGPQPVQRGQCDGALAAALDREQEQQCDPAEAQVVDGGLGNREPVEGVQVGDVLPSVLDRDLPSRG